MSGRPNKKMKLTKPRGLEWTRLCSLSPVLDELAEHCSAEVAESTRV
jgi:hypothetical protein